MATPLGTVFVRVVPNMAGFNQQISQHLQQTGGQANAPAQQAGDSLGKKLLVGFGAAFAGLGGLLSAGLDNLREDTAVAAQVEAVIKSTGGAANVTADQMNDLALSIRNKTATDDAAVLSGEAMLATFTNIRNETGKGNDIFNQATRILVDMSRAMGTDTKTQAIQLGKALNDPIAGISALSRVGVTFTDQQKDLIRSLVESGNTMGAQKIILAELNKEFGGSAEAYGKTLPGAIDKAKFAFDDFTEALAEHAVPAVIAVANIAEQKVLPVLSDLAEQVGPVVVAIGKDLVEGVQRFAHIVAPGFEDAAEAGQHFVRIVASVARELAPLAKVLLALGLGAIAYGFLAIAKAANATLGFLDRHRLLIVAIAVAWAAVNFQAIVRGLQLIGINLALAVINPAFAAAGAISGLGAQLRTLGSGSLIAGTAVGLGLVATAFGAIFIAEKQLANDARQRQQIKQEIAEIGKTADALNPGSIQAVDQKLKAYIATASDSINTNGKFIESVLKISGAAKSFDEINAKAGKTNAAVKELADTYNISESAVRSLAKTHKIDLGEGLSTTQEKGGNAATVFRDLKAKMVEGLPTTKGTADALEKVGKKADATQDDIDSLKESLDALFGVNIDASAAADSFAGSLDDLSTSVKENGRSITGNTAAARSNRETVRQAAQQAISHAEAVARQTNNIDAGKKVLNEDLQRLRDRAYATGLNKTQVDQLLKSLGLLPAKKDVPVNVPGADAAKRKVNELAGAIGALSGKTVTLSVATQIASGNLIRFNNGKIVAGATGGRVVGSGTDTSDNIPTLLSPGEYVIRAASARKIGYGTLSAWNRMAEGGIVRNIRVTRPSDLAVGGVAALGAASHVTREQVLAAAGFGASIGGGVAAVTAVARSVLGLLHRPISELAGWVRRIMFESGGSPTIVNRTDSNWLAGHPSVGQAQVIRGTFARYAGPFRGVGPFLYGVSTNPLANQYAGANYAIHTYGSLAAVDPLRRRGGYDKGGWLMPGETLAVNNTGRPERVLAPGESAGITQINNWTVTGDDPHTTAAVIDERIKANNAELLRMIRAGVGSR